MSKMYSLITIESMQLFGYLFFNFTGKKMDQVVIISGHFPFCPSII